MHFAPFRVTGCEYGQVLSKFNSHYKAHFFTSKDWVTQMKGLLMFAELSEDVYFMPRLLHVVSSEVVTQYRVSKEKALDVYFPQVVP